MTQNELSKQFGDPNTKLMMRGRSVAWGAAKLVVAFCLLGLASASAAVFTINGTIVGGATFTGTLTIDTVLGTVTGSNITIGAPFSETCSGVPAVQLAAGSPGYFLQITCTGATPLSLVLLTPLSPAGTLVGYAGGGINTSAANFSFLGTAATQVAAGTLSASLPPTFSKTFSQASVVLGSSVTLTFNLSNPNGSALTGLTFTDTLPAGLVVATPNGLTGTCSGTLAATAGSTSVSLTNGALAANGNCSFSVSVTSVSAGIQNNATSTLTSNEAAAAPAATASISVVLLPPTFSKAFNPATIYKGTLSTLTFTIQNPNIIPVTGVVFSDTLPVGLIVATPNALTTTCGGTATATAGSNSISLTAGALLANSSCTISVSVMGISAGTQNNTTSTLTSTLAPTAPAATASIVVLPFALDSSFQVSYAANPAAGESYVNIMNTGANGASLLGPGFGAAAGNICVNAYTFSPDEQLISCCSCFLTPNAVANLGVNRDLTVKTLTGVVPTSVVIKLVATLAGNGGTGAAATCNNSAAAVTTAAVPGVAGNLVPGMVAYGTTPQSLATNVGPFTQVEHAFVPSTLSAGEVASIAGRCASILGNGSGFGVCLSCKPGALGGQKQ